jgi:MFS family permease
MLFKNKKILIHLFSALVFVALARTAQAVTIGVENPLGYETVEDLVNNSIRPYLMYIVGGVTIVFIAVSGILYILGGAGQNENMIRWSKMSLFGAILGLVVILAAPIIIDELYFIVTGQQKNFSELSASQILMRAINFLLAIVGIIFLISMLIGGIWFFAAGSDESKLELGKKTLRNSIIGLVVALAAMIIIRQLDRLITGGGQ